MIGHWKNFDDLEENLSLPELEALLMAYREQKAEDRKFMAALKGIDLDKEGSQEESAFERVKKRAEAALSGKSETEVEFADLGLGVES